jgi:hypothetical protein
LARIVAEIALSPARQHHGIGPVIEVAFVQAMIAKAVRFGFQNLGEPFDLRA